jgi:hypothetical protein
MKYYETTFEDYLNASAEYNIHPELEKIYSSLSPTIQQLGNVIVYGPTGIGKYTQVLNLLKKYSPSSLKYERKIVATTEKNDYQYKISDIHYEIDMALLGCNSKILWHEIFSQIVDIVSVNSIKTGYIVCKNFHMIHSELLEIFYSYIQQYNHSQTHILIRFILLTEHISFIPDKIVNICQTIKIGRPSNEKYAKITTAKLCKSSLPIPSDEIVSRFFKKEVSTDNSKTRNIIGLIKTMDTSGITNIKELKSFDLLYSNSGQVQELPDDNFNIICNKIIESILIEKEIDYLTLRDNLYDILTYNLDVVECLWYILSYLITNQNLQKKDISDICNKSYNYLKCYNNNYRPIYHLESMFFYITIKVHGFNEL